MLCFLKYQSNAAINQPTVSVMELTMTVSSVMVTIW